MEKVSFGRMRVTGSLFKFVNILLVHVVMFWHLRSICRERQEDCARSCDEARTSKNLACTCGVNNK